MSTNNKRDMEASEDDDEFEEDYKDGSSLHDAVLRKIGMLCQRCVENERLIKRLKMELRLSKSHARQTKRQIRIDYNLDGKEADFSDSVLSLSRNICFHVLNFWRTDGWNMKGQDSFSTFVQGKVQIPERVEYKDQWERVICPTIQAKYVTIRCNLNNEIQRTYKSKFIQIRTMLFQQLAMTYNLFFLLIGDPGRKTLDPDLLGEMVKIEWGSDLLNQIFNLIARYVQKVHSDEYIRRAIHFSAGRSFLDVIGPSDIMYMVSIIKNSMVMWDQDIQVQELGAEGMENPEKKLKPLFTSGSDQKRT
jgi:hypothetical protein